MLFSASAAAPLGGWHRVLAPAGPATAVFEVNGGQVFDIAVAPDGAAYVAGDFTSVDGTARVNLARFTPTGELDPLFAPAYVTGTPFSIALQTDGTLLVGGRITSVGGELRYGIVRFTDAGALDPTFRTGMGFGSAVCLGPDIKALLVQPDGRILVGGCMTDFDGETIGMIVRLNADGTRDSTFDVRNGFNAPVNAIALHADGRIVVGGDFTSYGGAGVGRVARLNADGTLDATFAAGSGCNQSVYSLAVQADGAVLINGIFDSYNGTPCDGFVRVGATGARDAAFTPPPGLLAATSMDVLPGGKVLLGGAFYSTIGTIPNRMARIHADGTLDPSFQPGAGFDDDVQAVGLLPDGGILAGGRFRRVGTEDATGLAWLDSSGGLSERPPVHLRQAGEVRSVAATLGGKWLVGGSFDVVDGQPRPNMARLNPNGSLDASFDPVALLRFIEAIASDAEGRAIAGGWTQDTDGGLEFKLVRYLPTGDVDPQIGSGLVLDGGVRALAVMPDGKIVACGAFTRINGVARERLVRLTAEGAVDAAFAPDARPNEELRAMGVQADGCIIIAGTFRNADDTLRVGSIRIRPDGTIDPGYQGPGAGRWVNAIAVQPDGRILIAGQSFTNTLVPYGPVTRFLPDGTLDTTFSDGVEFNNYNGFNGAVRALALQPDGRIWVAGDFFIYRGMSVYGLARLNPDGTLDGRLEWSDKPSAVMSGRAAPLAMATDPAGNVLLGGTWMLGPDIESRGAIRLEAATLANLSVRSGAGQGERTLIVGLVMAGGGAKPVLMRAVGPGLVRFGVGNALVDPRLTLYQRGVTAPLLVNENWGGTEALKQVFASVGAFRLGDDSLDAAFTRELAGGVYSAHVTSNETDGVALAEAYDAGESDLRQELINISTRSYAGTGDETLILGFVIRGNWSRRLLIRGVGPSLQRHGVDGTLADPVVMVYSGGRNELLAYNDNWEASPELAAISKQTGAFALDPQSADAATVVVLPPGLYTAHVNGRRGETGVALVEAYVVD